MTVMSELTEDLLEEILCRVPTLSLKRIQTTCKLWNRVFNDKRFRRRHLEKSPKQFMVHMSKGSRVCSTSVTGEFRPLDPHYSDLGQFEITSVSHCDGLLLSVCVFEEGNTRLLVCNPCLGQKRWINHNRRSYSYAFGSYQDSKSHDYSYKILSYGDIGNNHKPEIYEINSNSWRILDVTLDICFLGFLDRGVSLKGKTYWIGIEKKEERFGIFLASFDYTTERFERQCLPRYSIYRKLSLSVVREEKLSLLLQRDNTFKTEVWVTNKICETKVMSWSKVFAVDIVPESRIQTFLVDEEKRVLVCCDISANVNIVGEDNTVKKIDSIVFKGVNYDKKAESKDGASRPSLVYYVPSLTQVHQGMIQGKRKRGE